MNQRESLSSRIGFILLSAGCAIGLGNVWRFPYICGQYGGAYFVLVYLFFLAILGFPCMLMELAIGRASRMTLPHALSSLCLRPDLKRSWKITGNVIFIGNIVLMMFYTVITGWLLRYMIGYTLTTIEHLDARQAGEFFDSFLASPKVMLLYTAIVLILTLLICASGLMKGVERVTKFMMVGLLVLMIVQAIQNMFLPNAMKGLSFFLAPNVETLTKGFGTTVYAAMNQAFFTLSIGVGSIAIFGSYTTKENALPGEALTIIGLDTFVAICAGLIIFPACFATGIEPGAGPGLIFVTLPSAFSQMPFTTFRGIAFFLFMFMAALTTVVAVMENIIAFFMEQCSLSRKKSTVLCCLGIFVLSIPCALGFNVWSDFAPFGKGSNVLDLEDFLISNNILPLGALTMSLFCTWKFGWAIDSFLEEVNTGKGLHLPKCTAVYIKYLLPLIIFSVWLLGIIDKFGN